MRGIVKGGLNDSAGGSGGLWEHDWSAYTTQFDWGASNQIIISANSWGEMFSVSGEGYLSFLRVTGSGGSSAGIPQVRLTVDGESFLFDGLAELTHRMTGNVVYQPIVFKESLKVETYNNSTSSVRYLSHYTCLIKHEEPTNGEQTLLSQSYRKVARNDTNSTTPIDILNVTGSGYLTGIEVSAYLLSVTTGYTELSLIVDGVISFTNMQWLNLNSSDYSIHSFIGPIRFNSSLVIRHRVVPGSTVVGSSRVFYTLD